MPKPDPTDPQSDTINEWKNQEEAISIKTFPITLWVYLPFEMSSFKEKPAMAKPMRAATTDCQGDNTFPICLMKGYSICLLGKIFWKSELLTIC